MQYTIEQLSKLLNRKPRTLYRLHVEHNMGKIGEVAEGRRLLFSEEEYQLMVQMFADRSKEKLLTNETVATIIDTLQRTPMTVYDLARRLKIKKSSLQTLIAAMTTEFEELAEDYRGILYWKGYSSPDINEGFKVRHVYRSYISKAITMWYTYSDVGPGNDPGYQYLGTDKCLYTEDVNGKWAYENDIVQLGSDTVLATDELEGNFKIVGNVYDEHYA